MGNPALLPAKAAHLSLSTLLGVMALAAFPLDSDAQQKKVARAFVPMELQQPASATPWSRYSGWPATDWKDYNTLANIASPAYEPPPKLDGPIAGDPKNGEKLAFDRGRGGSCVACHVMGKTTPAMPGNVGPDLTAYQRDNLGTLLISILNPNAEIREGYAYVEVETTDGRSLGGFLTDRDGQVAVLRGLDGQDITLRAADIRSIEPTGRSLMPEGLLDDLKDDQLRDLLAYLRSSQPFSR